MITDIDILKKLQLAEKELLFKNRQFSGAVTVSLIKEIINSYDLYTSEKDVFIKNIPIEVDLLLVKKDSKPKFGVLWEPLDIIAAFEVKKSGLIDTENTFKISSDFSRIKTYYPHIKLFYITLSEIRNNINDINKADNCFTFFIRKNGKYSSTLDFDKFINILKELKQTL